MLFSSATLGLLLLSETLGFVLFVPDPGDVNYGYCNKTISSSTTVTSPNYPNAYPTSLACVYYFQAPPGSKSQVDFRYVDTEPCCDYIEVFDGPDTNSPKFPKKLGGRMGSTDQIYTSSQGPLTVRFYSDLTVTYSGFSACFRTV